MATIPTVAVLVFILAAFARAEKVDDHTAHRELSKAEPESAEELTEKRAEDIATWGEWSEWRNDNCDKEGIFKKLARRRGCLITTNGEEESTTGCAGSNMRFQYQYAECGSEIPTWGEWSEWRNDYCDIEGPLKKRARRRGCFRTINDDKELMTGCAGSNLEYQYEYAECETESEPEPTWGPWDAWTNECRTGGQRERIRTCNKNIDGKWEFATGCSPLKGVIDKEIRDCHYGLPMWGQWTNWENRCQGSGVPRHIRWRDCFELIDDTEELTTGCSLVEINKQRQFELKECEPEIDYSGRGNDPPTWGIWGAWNDKCAIGGDRSRRRTCMVRINYVVSVSSECVAADGTKQEDDYQTEPCGSGTGGVISLPPAWQEWGEWTDKCATVNQRERVRACQELVLGQLKFATGCTPLKGIMDFERQDCN